jgi:hypothetical protein
MKIKTTKKFEPITIILETYEEALIMRQRLNLDWITVKERGSAYNLPQKDINNDEAYHMLYKAMEKYETD